MRAERRTSYRRVGVASPTIGGPERANVLRALAAGRLSYGPFSRRFERGFADAHDSRFAVFVSSGTAALHLAIAALKERHGWRDGDEILVPAVTFVATVNAVLHNRMTPVLVDVDPESFNIAARLIEAKITPRTRALIPVHLLGLPCDLAEVLAVAKRRRLRVIEDACEAAFARYRGKAVGSFGDVGCFSTHAAHHLVTGVGGICTTGDAAMAVRLRSLANHGRDPIYLSIDDGKGARAAGLRAVVARRFSFVSVGHSFRATELEAALGVAQLARRETMLRARRANARRLAEGLADVAELRLPATPADREHSFMAFPLVVRRGSKTALVNHLEERGVETRDLLPLVTQPVYRRLFGSGFARRYPAARRLARRAFYVGCHQGLSRRDLEHVIGSVRGFFRR